jgi:hypothetical protein
VSALLFSGEPRDLANLSSSTPHLPSRILLPSLLDFLRSPAVDGAYITGMFVEGARWCHETMMLAESQPKVLFSPAPMMVLSPCEASNQETFPHYECPLYR